MVPEPPATITWSTFAAHPDLGRLTDLEADGPPFLAGLTADHRRRHEARWADHLWLGTDVGDADRGGGRSAASEAAVAAVRAVAIRWDGTTGDAPARGLGELLGGADPDDAQVDTLAVVDLAVHPAARGRGVGARVLCELPGLAAAAGFTRLLVLLRPHRKHHHPLVPFVRYLTATDDAGRPHDGWLRAAWDAGLHPVRAVDRSLVARAPVAAWQRWYGRGFPTSGPYLVAGAIKPAIVELERDEGRYREPHLWVAPRDHLTQRTVDAPQLRAPEDAWRRALAGAGVVAGSRRHREVRRTR
jgi:GNAT superfamily N-acetyltransferase